MRHAALMLAVLFLLVGSYAGNGSSAESPKGDEQTPKTDVATLVIPAEERQRKNPVPPTEESIAYGKLLLSSQ